MRKPLLSLWLSRRLCAHTTTQLTLSSKNHNSTLLKRATNQESRPSAITLPQPMVNLYCKEVMVQRVVRHRPLRVMVRPACGRKEEVRGARHLQTKLAHRGTDGPFAPFDCSVGLLGEPAASSLRNPGCSLNNMTVPNKQHGASHDRAQTHKLCVAAAPRTTAPSN